MRLTGLSARAHPDGNRIDLTWINPDPLPDGYRLLIVRAVNRYAGTPEDGTVITPPPGAATYADMNLSGETVYYYTFFPFPDADAPEVDPRNRVAAMATAPYDLAGLMYGLLPEIYRRYDAATVLTERLARGLHERDRDRGILRRFLDLPGGQLDQLYSMARAALRMHDVERVDGALLPLLAQWIGWRTDHAATLAGQRNEIRFAPWIYRRTGTAVAVQATTARLTGRQCRIKEYVHNVARTNQPERLNLWTMTRDANGEWSSPELMSVNYAYDGHAAQAPLPDGVALIYHTYRRHGFDIWIKRLTADGWSASEPVVDRIGVDKHPTAALAGGTLWVFWQTSRNSTTDPEWRIAFRTRPAADETAEWSDIGLFGTDVERRAPAVVADDSGGLWLFWRQRDGQRWQTRYNRYDGAEWLPDDRVLLSETAEPQEDEDLAVLFHPGAGMPRLWLVWARKRRGGDADSWLLTYRTKNGLDPAATDWSPELTVPQAPSGVKDREPTLSATERGIELFYSSTRSGGWSLYTSRLDHGTLSWSAAEPVVEEPFTSRAPTVITSAGVTVLVYRSNHSLSYSGGIAPGASLDTRYGGTTTVDSTATAKLALRGEYEDFQTYTYDSRRAHRPGFTASARDTVGLDLASAPGDADPQRLAADAARLSAVLPEYLPITARAVILDGTPR